VTRQDETALEQAAADAAEALVDGAAPIDALDGGGAGEDAAAIVRNVAARAAVTVPVDGDGDGAAPTGGPWARWKQRTTQGAPFYPLGVLFGLNMADELDPRRSASSCPRSATTSGSTTTGS
jgi:hypothetical protein